MQWRGPALPLGGWVLKAAKCRALSRSEGALTPWSLPPPQLGLPFTSLSLKLVFEQELRREPDPRCAWGLDTTPTGSACAFLGTPQRLT